MTDQSRQVCVKVSCELLAQALPLPDGSEILDAMYDGDGIIRLTVANDSLPIATRGVPLRECHVVVHRGSNWSEFAL